MTHRDDKQLREARLVYYRQDISRIDAILTEFLEKSESKCAILIDKDGHPITRVGEVASYDMDTISALVAGSFAATREMARLLGEEEFSVLFHQGKRDNIQLSLVGNRALFAVIFDEKTTIGMVRLYGNETSQRLAKVFAEIATRKGPAAGESERPTFGSDFDESAKKSLDDVFGGSE